MNDNYLTVFSKVSKTIYLVAQLGRELPCFNNIEKSLGGALIPGPLPLQGEVMIIIRPLPYQGNALPG